MELPDKHDLGRNARNSVFISYSRQDKRYLEGLQTQLAPYVREGSVTYWDDTKILPGSVWYKELEQALNSTKVAVFLVSADLLASDFIFKYELSPLLEAAKQEGVVIFSVVLSACAFMDTDLTNFQAVNAPSEPLNRMPRWKRDEVWAKTAKWIKNALS